MQYLPETTNASFGPQVTKPQVIFINYISSLFTCCARWLSLIYFCLLLFSITNPHELLAKLMRFVVLIKQYIYFIIYI